MQAFKQALEPAFNSQWALMQTHSKSVDSIGITTKTAGSDNRLNSISGRQLYVVP